MTEGAKANSQHYNSDMGLQTQGKRYKRLMFLILWVTAED